MFVMVFSCHFTVEICITVHTAIFTGVIHSNINTFNTSANASLIFIFPNFELVISDSFKPTFINTTGMFDIQRR